ncbi:hypothetical protein VV869_06355 [Photobacterium sp. MCCC 1A19761]|uniref:hypothetical protein n=1 Tax=Photobacterium sp. MCCC 1A19761 TaxID=3115000 RepID=UPI00307F54D6
MSIGKFNFFRAIPEHRMYCSEVMMHQACNPLENQTHFLKMAFTLAKENVAQGERPFSAVVVRNHQVIAQAVNRLQAQAKPADHRA